MEIGSRYAASGGATSDGIATASSKVATYRECVAFAFHERGELFQVFIHAQRHDSRAPGFQAVAAPPASKT